MGRLIYLSLTCPDIIYAIGVLSQFMHAPTQTHMEATYKILQNLKGCPSKGILYRKIRLKYTRMPIGLVP